MKTINSIDKINQLTKNDFIDIFGNVFEKTNWIADKAFDLKPYKDIEELLSNFIRTYENSSKEEILKILNSHPELVVEKRLTVDSRKEQNNASLNQCSDKELTEFKKLNIDYKKKFGFPFNNTVKGKGKKEILENFKQRFKDNENNEYNKEKKQVKKIAAFRLNEIIS